MIKYVFKSNKPIQKHNKLHIDATKKLGTKYKIKIEDNKVILIAMNLNYRWIMYLICLAIISIVSVPIGLDCFITKDFECVFVILGVFIFIGFLILNEYIANKIYLKKKIKHLLN